MIFNYDVSDLQSAINDVEDGLAIVANGNTHAAIASGQYVYIKGHGTLADGLYKATAAIPLNGTLSGSNVSSVSSGGLNDLQNISSATSGQGYCKFPDGTLIQWGSIDVPSQSIAGHSTGSWYYYEITPDYSFPIPFTTLPSVIFSKAGGKLCSIGWSSWSTSKITEVDVLSSSSSYTDFGVTIHWIAIGKWK